MALSRCLKKKRAGKRAWPQKKRRINATTERCSDGTVIAHSDYTAAEYQFVLRMYLLGFPATVLRDVHGNSTFVATSRKSLIIRRLW